MKVYLALKHPRYPFGVDVRYLEAATVEGVFTSKDDAQILVDTKNAKTQFYKWSVQAKMVKGGSNVELSGARRASDSNAGLDDVVRYWLCCGSKEFPHGAESCYEARSGHPERVRWGTAKEHSDWQKQKSSNVK